MTITRTAEPTEEPITLEEAKLQARIDSDQTGEDFHVETLIGAAREEAESFLRGSIMPQAWELTLDAFPLSDQIALPFPPLRSVESIKYVDGDGVEQTLGAEVYQVDLPGKRVFLKYGQSWPATRSQYNAVIIAFSTGYASAAAVPSRIKAALLLTVADMYANREEAVVGTVVAKMPRTAENLLWPLRDLRF